MKIIIQLCILLSFLLITINIFECFKISKIYKITIFLSIVSSFVKFIDKSEIKLFL
jgi:hypothetical protein